MTEAGKHLTRLLKSRELEVEDILALARSGGRDDVSALRLLAENLTTRSGEVPYADWIRAVCEYLDDGHRGLVAHAQEVANIPFVLGVLEELRTGDAASSLAEVIGVHGENAGSGQLAQAFAASINALVSVGQPIVVVNERTARELREYLHTLVLRNSCEEPCYAFALYALRGVGDSESLRILQDSADATGTYAGAKKLAASAISKRVRRRS